MTTQELYNKVLAEEVTQQKFLYEVRRDINLPFITSNNNFKDTVKILKNKGIISEKKLSTGKQEVEIFAKTIDMVNPYEYSRGMNYELGVVIDAMGNRIADNAGDSMHIDDLTKDDVLKAQKKVLKNLTKNPQFYQQLLIPQMEGETEHAIEVTAKSIEDLKKKAGKIIREHGEDYEKVSKVMGSVSPLEEEELEEQGIDSEHVVKFKLAGNNYYNEATFIGTIPVNQLRSRYREGNEIEDYDGNSKKIVDVQIETRPRAMAEKKVEETNYGTGIKKDEQIAAKKMAVKRESIYEKYAEQYGVDVNELKDRLEAYKISQEEAIEVEDEDTAISVQKKSPDADVRIIEK